MPSLHHRPVVRRAALRLVAAAFASILVASQAAADEALILTSSIRDDVQQSANAVALSLAARGIGSTIVDLAPGDDPGDLSSFKCAWDFRVDFALSPIETSRFEDYLRGGGAIYFAGEHAGGFYGRDLSIAQILIDLGAGPVLVSPLSNPRPGPTDIPEPTNPAHPINTTCNLVTEVTFDGIDNGHFEVLGSGTWLTGSPVLAGAAVWDPGAMALAPDGRVVSALDINWSSPSPTGTLDFHIADRSVPTQNRAWEDNMITYLCVADLKAPKSPKTPSSGLPPRSVAPPKIPKSACSPKSASSASKLVDRKALVPRRANRSGAPLTR